MHIRVKFRNKIFLVWSSCSLAVMIKLHRFFRGLKICHNHHAREVTRVSVMPRKVTVKIEDAENRCRGCRDKNQRKRAKIPVRLVLSRVPFKSGV